MDIYVLVSERGLMKKEIIIKFEGSEILERTASSFGTGCHVIIPKEYNGRNVKIIFDASDNSRDKKIKESVKR